MITEFIDLSMSKAKYELLEWWEWFYWEIQWFDWVWANAFTLEECRLELKEILEEWLILKIRKKLFVPNIENYSLNELICEK